MKGRRDVELDLECYRQRWQCLEQENDLAHARIAIPILDCGIRINMVRTLYDAVGVSRTASKKEIEAACFQLGEQLRPDKNDSAEAKARFATLSQTYEILLDDQMRSEYDNELDQFEATERSERYSAKKMESRSNLATWGAILLLIGIVSLLIQLVGFQLRIIALVALFGASSSVVSILCIVAGIVLMKIAHD